MDIYRNIIKSEHNSKYNTADMFIDISISDSCESEKKISSAEMLEPKRNTDFDENSGYDLQYGEIFSVKGDFLYGGPFQINDESLELIDNNMAIQPSDLNSYKSHHNFFKTICSTNDHMSTPHDVTLDDISEIINNDFNSNPLDAVVHFKKQYHECNETDAKEININKNDLNTENNFQVHSIFNNKDSISKGVFRVSGSCESNSIRCNRSEEIECDIISDLLDLDAQNTDDDGYNSSDFEFITENEAKIAGIITKNTNNVNSRRSMDGRGRNVRVDNSTSRIKDYDNCINTDSEEDSSLMLHLQVDSEFNQDYRANHMIPEGDDYLDLFQGPYNPRLPVSDIILLENKSTRPSAMNLQYEGFGFNDQLVRQVLELDNSGEEYENEAKESVEKILFMYPDQNRKRGRTF